jgi:hypothetical protein
MASRIRKAGNGRRRNHLAVQSGAPSVEEILDDLNASQIDASISLVTPGGGFYAELGDPMRAAVWECASIWEAVEWLQQGDDQALPRQPVRPAVRPRIRVMSRSGRSPCARSPAWLGARSPFNTLRLSRFGASVARLVRPLIGDRRPRLRGLFVVAGFFQ